MLSTQNFKYAFQQNLMGMTKGQKNGQADNNLQVININKYFYKQTQKKLTQVD